MDQLQRELAEEFPELSITLFGCNAAGEESDNGIATTGIDLAWLQDVDADMDGNSDAWVEWGTDQRDFIIAGTDNRELIRLNLTAYSLFIPENYDLVKAMLIDAIHFTQRGDVNRDGVVNLLDVGPMVDAINSQQYRFEADANANGSIDFDDVVPFVDLLLGN